MIPADVPTALLIQSTAPRWGAGVISLRITGVSVNTAAGTSPLTSRSMALACPALSWTSAAPDAAIAVRIASLEADCCSPIATSLPERSATDLISGCVITSATRSSVLIAGTEAGGSASAGWTLSARTEVSVLFASCGGLGAAAAVVTRSASAAAAATCSCIVVEWDTVAAPSVEGDAVTGAGAASEPAAALPAGGSSAVLIGGNGMTVLATPDAWRAAYDARHVDGCSDDASRRDQAI